MPATAGPGPHPGPTLTLDPATVPAPDRAVEPAGYMVAADDGTRIHFLDWDGPDRAGEAAEGEAGDAATADREAADRAAADLAAAVGAPTAPVLLVPGFGETAWSWAPVARRLRARLAVVAMDLRGHGLSDAPVDGYETDSLARDALAVLEGSGALESPIRPVVAGHGFGACVAAAAAALLGSRCRGLVLVDGGWESLAETSELSPDELIRALEEPPEVLRSMSAYLADRRAFDPGTWDADQERAARDQVAELPSGRLVPAIHPHVRDGVVAAMFAYEPVPVLAAVEAPVLALVGADDDAGAHGRGLGVTAHALRRLGRPPIAVARLDAGHNLMRYRPGEVAAAILGAAEAATRGG